MEAIFHSLQCLSPQSLTSFPSLSYKPDSSCTSYDWLPRDHRKGIIHHHLVRLHFQSLFLSILLYSSSLCQIENFSIFPFPSPFFSLSYDLRRTSTFCASSHENETFFFSFHGGNPNEIFFFSSLFALNGIFSFSCLLIVTLILNPFDV